MHFPFNIGYTLMHKVLFDDSNLAKKNDIIHT